MRVAGYVRESADAAQGRSAFAQQEELRRYAASAGHTLFAICQDLRVSGEPPTRDGYLALLGTIATGRVEAVLVPDLVALSSDQVVQEIMLWDLRSRGIPVLSADPRDQALLDLAGESGPTRMLIRDVLTRVGEHITVLAEARAPSRDALLEGDILIHIVHADEAEVRAERG